MPDLHAVNIPITLRFNQGFHLGTGQREGRVHRTVRRTADGAPYVPGSALKGALRQTAEQFVRTLDGYLRRGDDVPDDWRLGLRRRGDQKTSEVCVAPRPEQMCQSTSPCLVCRVFGNTFTGRRLVVDDAYLATASPEAETLRSVLDGDGPVVRREGADRAVHTETVTRLQMDRRRNGAKHGALFTTEYARAHAPFQGSLDGRVPLTPIGADGPPAELVLLAAALRATDQVGGEASSGRGECTLTVEHQASSSATEGAGEAAGAEPALTAGGRSYVLDDLLEEEVLESLAWSEVDM